MQLAHIQRKPLYQIFLDLTKAYDTLDCTRTLQILEGYGVGERCLRLLCNFWEHLVVVARQQNFYGNAFPSNRGTTQGDIISPTIFNIVTDAIVRTWFQQLELEGIADVIRATFYADDGHIYSTNATALQRATDILVDLFTRMGLKTNAMKTKAMICAPPPSTTRISSPAYQRRMLDNSAPTYSARKRQLAECNVCQATIQERNLKRHKRLRHGIDEVVPEQQNTPPHLIPTSNKYRVSMPNLIQIAQCPVPGCGATIRNRCGMRRHFMFRHYYDTIIIEEEGLYERCEKCGMFCSPLALAGAHHETAICKRGAKRNQQKAQNLACI
jgi:hypothetical protein